MGVAKGTTKEQQKVELQIPLKIQKIDNIEMLYVVYCSFRCQKILHNLQMLLQYFYDYYYLYSYFCCSNRKSK